MERELDFMDHIKNMPNNMDELIEIQKKIVPELIDLLMKRYDILRLIAYYQPIGRRNLANAMGIGERIIRKEIGILKDQGFIEVKAEGMNITCFGHTSLQILKNYIHSFKGLKSLEKEVTKKLQIKKAMIVPGFYDEDPFILRDVGKTTSIYLKTLLTKDMVVGVTGGSTMACVAEEMGKEEKKHSRITFVPARGGLGKKVEMQSNTIASKMAQRINASYKILHMPDNISKEILESLSKDPDIKEVVNYIHKIGTLVFGIGKAEKLANRRGLKDNEIQKLKDEGAVAEAFGYYFNKEGKIIKEVDTVGVSLETYKSLKNVIGAAAGKEKAEAILAIAKLNQELTLVVDEGLAKEILKTQ